MAKIQKYLVTFLTAELLMQIKTKVADLQKHTTKLIFLEEFREISEALQHKRSLNCCEEKFRENRQKTAHPPLHVSESQSPGKSDKTESL